MPFAADSIYLAIFLIVLVQAGRTMCRQSPAAAAVLSGLLLVMFLVYRRREAAAGKINGRCLWVILQLVSVALMLAEMKEMELKLSWDWGVVVQTAYQYAVCAGQDVKLRYFAAYPNNQFWTVCLTVFFKIIHKLTSVTDIRFYKWMSMLLAGCLTQGSLWLIWQTARMHFSEKKAFLTGCIGLFFLPVYLYAGLAYTDVPGMFLMVLLLYVYSKMKKTDRHRLLYCLLMGGIAALALRIKVTVFIFLIAVVIEEIFSVKNWKRFLAGLLAAVISMSVILGCTGKMTSHIMLIDQEMQDRYEFPVTHWIMMGLNKHGGYQESEVQYTYKFTSYDEKKAANLKKIRKRIAAYGPIGLSRHIFADKTKYTWCKSCLAGDYYGTKNPYDKNTTWNLLSPNGAYHHILLLYTWPYYMILLLSLLLSAIRAFGKKQKASSFFFICRLSLTGVFLFLAMWECNSRYLVSFIPVLILTAGDGLLGGNMDAYS